jgi:hypothetical protein
MTLPRHTFSVVNISPMMRLKQRKKRLMEPLDMIFGKLLMNLACNQTLINNPSLDQDDLALRPDMFSKTGKQF